jgi:steroid delta-isomerase-like uncharacterized protein
MAYEQYTATVKRFADDFWNKRNYAIADEVLAPNYTNHDPAAPDIERGIEPYKQWANQYHTAIPDFHLEINDIIADGNKVVWRWNAHGTHKGPLMGIPPTGKTVHFSGTVVSQFDNNGKWAEDWSEWNALGLFQQIGVVAELR